MKRKEAINKLAKYNLENLTKKQRFEELEYFMIEDWSDEKEWKLISKKIQKEFKNGEIKTDVNSNKFDKLLLALKKYEIQSVSNNYLKIILKLNEDIIGKETQFVSCPCCGTNTLGIRGEYQICRICWWEDDGNDNNTSDETSSPNFGITLTQSRINFLKFGIYDPKRKGLLKKKDDLRKYSIGRVFEVKQNNIYETDTNWKREITE